MRFVPLAVVLDLVLASALLGLGYLRHYRPTRPPIGVINGYDLAFIGVAIVAMPYVYLALPLGVVVTLVALVLATILGTVATGVVHHRALRLLVVAGLVGLDVVVWRVAGAPSPAFALANDAVLVVAAVGIANLWVQGGMRASAVALLAAGLTVYDAVATVALPTTNELVTRLATHPFAPLLTWGSGPSRLGVGFGDLIVLTLFPAVMWKAFGARAGRIALVTSQLAAAAMATSVATGAIRTTIPAMTFVGPLVVLQVLVWRRRVPVERTMARFEAAPA